jgi:UDP-N-acetylmuramoyl-L-alanyl-D-glutamate--2,6-diaminopimelate ligase
VQETRQTRFNSSLVPPDMRLIDLARAAGVPIAGRDVEISGIATDSRAVNAGELFVAVPGSNNHGMAFVPAALERGAVAICGTAPVPGVPTLLSGNPRRALAALAAAFQSFPAHELPLIGITGSLGKTSTAMLLEAALRESGIRAGVIGSLGVRFDGESRDTGMTTPEATEIHASLRRFVDAGAGVAVMEVTTHAIVQERVAGLVFALGVLTNLVPDEHLEFHPTPEHYIRTKARFFDMLAERAPLVLNIDDETVRSLTASLRRPLIRVSGGEHPDAHVQARGVELGSNGTTFELAIARRLMRADGSTLEPLTIPLELSLLGRQQVTNASLAATAALLTGATPEAIRRAFATMPQVTRRMQVVHARDPFILDDTVGNPASLQAVFETVASIPHARLLVAYAVRGSRGVTINRYNAEALAASVETVPAEIVLTSSEDATDDRNRVTEEEWNTVTAVLRERDIAFRIEPSLRDAVTSLVDSAGAGDLVLLLGAQGMDAGAQIARETLATRSRVA